MSDRTPSAANFPPKGEPHPLKDMPAPSAASVYASECARIAESQRAPLQPIPVTASTVKRYARLMRLRGVEPGPELSEGLAAVHPTAVDLNNLVLTELRRG